MSTVGVGHRAQAAWWLALFGVMGALMGARAGGGTGAVTLEPFLEPAEASNPADAASSSPTPIGVPVELEIPALGLRAPVRPVGLDHEGALVTPPAQETGWFDGGPVPGSRGSAVIVGHVDTANAPAVFARLHELTPGALLGVRDSSGAWTIFRVEGRTQHPKDALPEAVWAPGRERLLRLITCGGAFDRRTGHYRDNVVVHTRALGRWTPSPAAVEQSPPWDRLGR